MRHARKGYKLSRTASHRKATLAALSGALIQHKRITTTLTKAKALRIYIEPLITRAREDTTHNRREVFRHLMDKAAVTELFDEISGRVGDRPGGYTRIVRLGQRQGDAAEMAVIELVDYNDSVVERRRARRRRTRRGSRRRRSEAQEIKSTAAVAASSLDQEEELLSIEDTAPSEVADRSVGDDVANAEDVSAQDGHPEPADVSDQPVEGEVAEAEDVSEKDASRDLSESASGESASEENAPKEPSS